MESVKITRDALAHLRKDDPDREAKIHAAMMQLRRLLMDVPSITAKVIN